MESGLSSLLWARVQLLEGQEAALTEALAAVALYPLASHWNFLT